MPDRRGPTRVLIVDDSAIVRKLLGDALRGEPDIEVIGGAADPYIARDMIVQHRPDLVTLDIEMPRMDGLTFLRKLMQHHPMPVIIISSVTKSGSAASIEALRAGAVDVIPKPGGPTSVGQVTDRLKERIRTLRASAGGLRLGPQAPVAAAAAPAAVPAVTTLPVLAGRKASRLLLIGASTGGPQAIESLLSRLPADVPPTLIVQHMPATFTAAFAGRLNTVCPMRVLEAAGGEVLERGTVYLAPGDRHLLVERVGVQLRTVLKNGPPVHHQRPAVDVLFHAAARLTGVPMVAVLLTGMGADGADGMVALRTAGAETIAEDEHSCVVFGMPREAIARGGAGHVATLLRMPTLIYECFDALGKRAA
ncbi:MAG: chemotaxis response regulator protein-glutamate methylesterase [Vicinamibacterales bacterium]